MKVNNLTRLASFGALAVFFSPAYGAVLGPLSITGSVDVSSTTIDWSNPFSLLPPLGGTFAGFQGTTGNILDLSIPGVVPPQANFLSGFSALPAVHFDLVTFNPTVAPACTGAEAVGQTCLLVSAAGPGPFAATVVPSGVSISTQVFGYFNDTGNTFDNGIGTAYTGVFSTQITNVTVAQIIATLNGGPGIPGNAAPTVPAGVVRATYSANFDAVSGVPEPATYAMIGVGLLGIWAKMKRRKS